MTEEEVRAKLTEILVRDFRVPKERVVPTASFRGSLGLDSLDAVDLIYLIKKTFSLEVNIHSFRDLHTVDDVVTFVLKSLEG
jgi:acyl carrier protein